MSLSNPNRRGATVAQLKADIDGGRTGDKVSVPDPGLASLGTDDEAAGTPNSPEVVARARRVEQAIGRAANGPDGPGRPERAWLPPLLIGLVVAVIIVGAVLALGHARG